tara:strand:- start:2224 stop:2841 length:618 start_codon:yes stop_codon:yes gene_type:complete
MSYDYLFKIIIIGEQGSGKTSIVKKLIHNKYEDIREPTIGLDFTSTQTEYDDKSIKYHFWDTAGQECFSNIIKVYYKNIACCFIVVEASDAEWEENLIKWLGRYKSNIDDGVTAKPIILVNKLDLKREFDEKEGNEFARDNDCLYYEVSAKTGANMKGLLGFLTKNIITNMNPESLGPGIARGITLEYDEENIINRVPWYLSCFS